MKNDCKIDSGYISMLLTEACSDEIFRAAKAIDDACNKVFIRVMSECGVDDDTEVKKLNNRIAKVVCGHILLDYAVFDDLKDPLNICKKESLEESLDDNS